MTKNIMKTPCIILGIILFVIAMAGMYKFNYLSGQPGYDVDGNRIDENLTQATDKIFGINQGILSPSDTLGFKNYTNKQLQASFLTPDSWDGQVGMGGAYTISPKDSTLNNRVDISGRTTTFNFLTNGNSPKNPTLDDYKKIREGFITEENIGQSLEVSMQPETFAEQEGYKISYTYILPVDGSQQFSTEYFTIRGDTIYILSFAGARAEKIKYQDTFDTIKNSYKILNTIDE